VDLVAAAAGVLRLQLDLSDWHPFTYAVRHVSSWNLRDDPGSASNGFLTRSTLPDSDRMSLHRSLAAECAGVSRVLRDFHLLDLFSEGGTISIRSLISPIRLS